MVFGGWGFGRSLGPKGRAFMNGIHALIKETPQSFPILSAKGRRNKKTSICEPGGGSPPETHSACALILDFPDPRIMKKKKKKSYGF